MPQLEKFEHYELLKHEDGSFVELGHGAMGITYKAFDTNLRCHVALKVISAAHLNDPTAAERFLREARGAAQLRHRNVASVFHLGNCGDSYFYAMEFIQGETVDARVKREGPLSAELAIEITNQVATALVAASKQGLVHRDIKPANLMLLHEGDGDLLAKVIDFGLVKSALIGSTAGALTSTGFVGTPYFASPEQLDARSEDIRSDIYSLGVTLWFMLTGKPTFLGSVASVIAQHLDKPPPFESLAVLPVCIVDVLRKMLEKEVDRRIQTPTELRAELKRCLDILRCSQQTPNATASMTYQEATDAINLSSVERFQPQPSAGSVLGSRYQLIEDLDPHNPGRIFHAEDTEQKRRVRLKMVRCSESAFATIRDQVSRIQGAAHTHFMAVLAAERMNAFGYVVSEWLEGFALVDLLRARRELTIREVLSLIAQIAPAIDKAGELGVRPALDLRDVLIHFPEGFDEPNEQVLLRCPIAEWPAYLVKTDPLGVLDEIEDLEPATDRTIVRSREAFRPTTISQLASISYDLLGGKPGASGPLANISEEANRVLRHTITARATFPSAQEFVTAFGKASTEPQQATQPMTAVDPKLAAASVPVPRSAAPAEKSSTPAPAPAPASAAVRRTRTEEETAKIRPRRNHGPTIAAFVGLAVLVVAAIFLFSEDKPASKRASPAAGIAKGPTPLPAAPRLPPKPGKPWKNSLGMTYIPMGSIWVAMTETRVRDFQAFYEATNYDATGGMDSLQKDGLKDHGRSWKDPGFKQSPEHPVVGISREDAVYFCNWLTEKEQKAGALLPSQSYRLPTDREWSEAVGLPLEPGNTPEERSGRIKGMYPWGRMFPPPDNAGNYAGTEAAEGAPEGWPVLTSYHDSYPRTCPVPGFTNEQGFFDLGGNVWEWCQGSYGKTNPRWGVLRGGSWATSRQEEMLSSYRRGFDPNFRADDVGFRCVIAGSNGR
jgi:serine/threonine protein kinase/formylglycine-generating enzyme required for sulfatase activity